MKETQLSIPHLFRCPISLDLFKDPVTLCTGQTYDRSSIEKWLATGNLTCPVTMQKLHDPSLVPNHTLKHLIEQWLQMGHHFDPDYLTTIDTFAVLRHTLESHDGNVEVKLKAMERIQVLCAEASSRKSCMVQLGFLPLLLELSFGKGESKPSNNVRLVEQALSCVLELLPFGELKCLNMLQKESKFASFVDLFEQGSTVIKIKLCQIIEAISSSLDTQELCARLGQNSKILQEIFHLIHQNSESSNAGIEALSALSSLESNQENLVEAGAVDGLITYFSSNERHKKSSVPLALSTLQKLAMLENAKEALINHPEGINAVVKMVFKVSDHEGSESAVSLLMTICNGSLKAREEAIQAGVLTQLLLLLQSQCDGATKTKARMLLKLLRSKSAGFQIQM